MSSDAPVAAEATFRTFADYVESLYNPPRPLEQYAIDFLRNGNERTVHVDTRVHGLNVYFIDRKSASQQSYSYKLLRNEPSSPDFYRTLKTLTPNTLLRVVLIGSGHLSAVDNHSFDALCLHYSLDPEMLFLLLGRLNSFSGMKAHLGIYSIPRSRSFCEFSAGTLTAVATILMLDAVPHILGLDTSYLQRITAFRDGLLQPSKPDTNNPVDILCLILEMALRTALSTYEYNAMEFERRYDTNVHTWASIQVLHRKLSRTLKSLSLFANRIERELGLDVINLRQIESDYRAVIEDCGRLGLDFQGQINMQESRAAIEESEKAIQQADSVRRLTLVAFIFIPLNFSTSFFGMNLEQLGTGTLSMGYFFLLAALAGLVSFCLSASQKPLERFWGREREKYLLQYQGGVDLDELQTTTKRDVLWGAIMKYSRRARISRQIWRQAMLDIADQRRIYERSSIRTSDIIVGWYKGVVKQLRKKPGSEQDGGSTSNIGSGEQDSDGIATAVRSPAGARSEQMEQAGAPTEQSSEVS